MAYSTHRAWLALRRVFIEELRNGGEPLPPQTAHFVRLPVDSASATQKSGDSGSPSRESAKGFYRAFVVQMDVEAAPDLTRSDTRLILRHEADERVEELRKVIYETIDLWLYPEKAKDIIEDEAASAGSGAVDA